MPSNFSPSRKTLWIIGSVIVVVLLIVAGVFRFAILPKQHDYVLQSKDISKIINRPSQPACDPKNLKTCPRSAPVVEEDIVQDPRYGKIARGELLVDFREDVSTDVAYQVISSLPAEIRSYQPFLNGYQIRLTGSDDSEALERALKRLGKDPHVRAVLVNGLGDLLNSK